MEQKDIINKWLDFLHYEDIERTKFNLNNLNQDLLFDINLIKNNTFKFDKKYTDLISKKYQNNRRNNNDLYLLFPLIKETRYDKNNNKFEYLLPLFAININSLKNEMFEKNELHLDLNNFKNYQVIINVFREIFGIEENFFAKNYNFFDLIEKITNIESENLKESLENLKKYYNENFENNKYSFYDKPFIISNIDINIFNEDLIEELKLLSEVNLNKSQVLKSYLFNNKNNDKMTFESNKIWFGNYNDFPLSLGQATAMQKFHNENLDILPVQGGPGTGKTTLLLNIMSNQIIRRALYIINYKKDFNNMTLISSNSNKAIDNITDILKRDFNDNNNLYFISGNMEKIKSSTNRINKLIEEMYEKQFNRKRFETLIQDIHKIVFKFNTDLMEYENAILIFNELKEEYKTEDYNVIMKRIVNKTKNFFLENKDEKDCDIDFENFNVNNEYKKFLTKIEDFKILKNKKNELETNIYKKFNYIILDNFGANFNSLLIINFLKSNCLKNLNDRCLKIKQNKTKFIYKFKFLFNVNNDVINNFNNNHKKEFDDFYISIDLNEENYENYLTMTNILFSLKSENKDLLEEYNKLSNIDEYGKILRQKYEILKYTKDLSKKFNLLTGYYNYNFRENFRNNEYKNNKNLFLLCEEFMFLYALKNKKEVIECLEHWKNILFYNNNTKSSYDFIYNDMNYFFTNISMVYPFITSTTSSLRNIFKIDFTKYYDEKPFDLSLVDERGMISIHNLATTLFRCKKRVIIGDTKQLEPIISISKNVIDDFRDNFAKKEDFLKYSPTEITSYHRAKGCENKNDIIFNNDIVLDEHRRCQLDIANTFINLSEYKNLKIKTTKLEFDNNSDANSLNNRMYYLVKDFEEKNLVFYHVKKTKNSKYNTNLDEVEKIGEILKYLKNSNIDLKNDVAIITPFLNQERLLLNYFSDTLNHTYFNAKIGTVHKFQGVEYPIVIFSSVISDDNDSEDFLNAKPNLLNVALSRTKYLYINVGNFIKLKNSGGYLLNYCKSFNDYGKIIK